MRVTLLGTGSPRPDPERASSSLLVAGGGRSFLVDCGRNVAVQMARAGVDPGTGKELLITHHHFDHICGLDDFALTSWISQGEPALRFYGPPGTREIADALFERVYRTDLASRHGINPRRRPFAYDVQEVAGGALIEDAGWRVVAAAVDHWSSALPQMTALCLAYRFEHEGRSVVVSGDTTPCEALVELAQGADLLVHECFGTEEDFARMRAEGSLRWAIHTSSGQLGLIAARAEAKRLVLTHLPQHCSPTTVATMEREVRRSYGGPVTVGYDLLALEV